MSMLATDAKNRTIVSTRIINAPREVVFNAFSDPEQLKHWWGPEGFTNTIEQFEFCPGGMWAFRMHGPDGTDYHNRCEFKEIVENEKVVFTHHQPVHQFDMTLGFEAVGNRTKFSFTMVFEDAGEVGRIRDFLIPANEQNFNKLEDFLYKTLDQQ